MAKHNANARSKRVANKKKAANRQKNEARNQSRSMQVKSMTYSMGVEALRPILMKNARDFYNSDKPFNYYVFKRGEEQMALGNILWGHEGIHPLLVRHSSLCWGIDDNSEIMHLWEDCLEEALIEKIKSGCCHFNYVVADSREEAVDKVKYALLNGAASA